MVAQGVVQSSASRSAAHILLKPGAFGLKHLKMAYFHTHTVHTQQVTAE